jgi:hypothetical protein
MRFKLIFDEKNIFSGNIPKAIFGHFWAKYQKSPM